jgi:signal transduction histidine kinase
LLAVLPILLMLFGMAAHAVIENSLDRQREKLSKRIQAARNNIAPLTSIRRDARKNYVALLERWLAPARDRPSLKEGIETQTQALLRSSQSFLHGVALSAGEQQNRVDLAAHLATWGTIVDRILGTAVGPDVLGEAHEQLAEIDRHCAEILSANIESASQDDAVREEVNRKYDLVRFVSIAMRPVLVAYVVVWYLRRRTAQKIAEALSQQRQKEEQNLVLDGLVRERTAELEKSHAWLAESSAQLFVAKEELEKRVHELATAQNQLVQAEKLQAVGQLAAGIAHEINTPAQFVGDGLHFLKEAFAGYKRLIVQYRCAVEALALETTGPGHVLVSELQRMEEDVDLPYLDANVPASLVSCMEGIFRISTIVESMKEFAQPDLREKSPVDLNHALQATLAVARHEYGSVAEVTTEYGDLPPVLCNVGNLNQVFLNLIINASHAIGDVVKTGGAMGTIRIKTSREGDQARIDITDSGSGIPEPIRNRVFDPFFTTKEVGKGTGQGLAIARSVIVTKHGGTLTFESEVGKGTTFTIRLPIGVE